MQGRVAGKAGSSAAAYATRKRIEAFLRNRRNPSAQSRAISGNVQLPRSAIIGAIAGNFGKRTAAKERNYRRIRG
jgi:hypothetical protein